MNLYQCQEKAKDEGFDCATFDAEFPIGTVKCEWLDAYMGIFKIKHPGLEDGFVTVQDIDSNYPSIVCSNFASNNHTGVQSMSDGPSMCWNCNFEYDINIEKCPECGSTNPNVDMDPAMKEIEDKTLIKKGEKK